MLFRLFGFLIMWVVVHFVNDNAVEAVPETWYKKINKTCAWPIVSKNSIKHIVKQDYPDENNYKWYPARVLGRKYGIYIFEKYL